MLPGERLGYHEGEEIIDRPSVMLGDLSPSRVASAYYLEISEHGPPLFCEGFPTSSTSSS
jgi:hypothetical protein